MTFLLLTGAGFSKNWGGWIASEVVSYLLDEDQLDEHTRDLLVQYRLTGGFENAMAALQAEVDDGPTPERQKRLDTLQSAIYGMFNDMQNHMSRGRFEFQNHIEYCVTPFLARFDAIFTLNQDTLLEAHYGAQDGTGKWSGTHVPGMAWIGQPMHASDLMQSRLLKRTPAPEFKFEPNTQPYFKLHGSVNWIAGTTEGLLMILGGEKEHQISRYPILSKYREQFDIYLSRPDVKLMIVGYGFNDGHINAAIARGVEKGLKVYIVDPRGLSAFDRQEELAGISGPIGTFTKLMRPAIFGESTRPFSDTFNFDRAEHARLMRFFR